MSPAASSLLAPPLRPHIIIIGHDVRKMLSMNTDIKCTYLCSQTLTDGGEAVQFVLQPRVLCHCLHTYIRTHTQSLSCHSDMGVRRTSYRWLPLAAAAPLPQPPACAYTATVRRTYVRTEPQDSDKHFNNGHTRRSKTIHTQ